MSHLSDLEAQYDGPIPRDLKAAAVAADRRALARRRTTPTKPPKAIVLKPVSDTFIIAEMAMVMVTRTRDHGACTESDSGKWATPLPRYPIRRARPGDRA